MNPKNWMRALICLLLLVASVAADQKTDSPRNQSLAGKRLH